MGFRRRVVYNDQGFNPWGELSCPLLAFGGPFGSCFGQKATPTRPGYCSLNDFIYGEANFLWFT